MENCVTLEMLDVGPCFCFSFHMIVSEVKHLVCKVLLIIQINQILFASPV